MSGKRSSRAGFDCVAVTLAAMSCDASAASPNGVVFDALQTPLDCVVSPRGKSPRYPLDMADEEVGGVVRIRLTFTAPDRPPEAQVFYDSVGGEIRAAALAHVSAYGMPCLTPGTSPIVATQEFQFVPGDGRRVVSAALRGSDERGARLGACLTGLEKPPAYPYSRTDKVEQGTVLARYTFRSPVEPPDVEILFDGGSDRFAKAVRDFAKGYRLPCMTAADAPVTGTQPFRFRMAGEAVALAPMPLDTLVGGIDRIEVERVRFDFTTMNCPFDLRFVLWRPHLRNFVGEIERSDPNRREFLEWLSRVDLKLPEKYRTALVGTSTTISVPCGVLDLL